MNTSWESEIAGLLTDLLAVQDELLQMLARKRELLVAADAEGLAAIGRQEEKLIGALQQCMARREELLATAGQEGFPSGSILALARALPRSQRNRLHDQVQRSKRERMTLLSVVSVFDAPQLQLPPRRRRVMRRRDILDLQVQGDPKRFHFAQSHFGPSHYGDLPQHGHDWP